MDPVIAKEMTYNLQYGEVRGDVHCPPEDALHPQIPKESFVKTADLSLR